MTSHNRWWWDPDTKWFRYGSGNSHKQMHVAPYFSTYDSWFAMDYIHKNVKNPFLEGTFKEICNNIVDGDKLNITYSKYIIKNI